MPDFIKQALTAQRLDDLSHPELDKQKAIIDSGRAATAQEFLDWLRQEKGIVLARWGDPKRYPTGTSLLGYRESEDRLYPAQLGTGEQILAAFFGIDLDKIDAERRALLETIRKSA